MKRLIVLLMASLLALTCGAVAAQAVKIVADKTSAVNQFPTFSMGRGDIVLVLKRALPDSIYRLELADRIVEEMKNRGYEFSGDSAGTLSISFIAEVLEKQESNQVGPLGQQPADNAGQVEQSQTWTQVLNQSSLTIVISDPNGKKIWQSQTISETASADVGEVLLSAAARSIRKVPKRK
jgi:hypothetical protein